jgi:glycosyltransferase involved in cell wall biosynthesis
MITEYFYPAQRNDAILLTKIAKVFSINHDIHIICTSELNNIEELGFVKGRIDRLKSINIKSNNIILKFIKLFLLSIKLFFKSLIFLKKDDKVFTVTNPLLFLPILIVIKKIKNFELTLLVYDVFPENLVATKIITTHSFIFKVLKKIYDWSYKNTDRLIVIGRDMKELIQLKTQNTIPIEIIENWCNHNEIIPSSKQKNEIIKNFKLEDKIVFSFTGNLGRVQGITNLLEAALSVTHQDFVLLFIGNGSERVKIENFIAEHKCENIIYAGEYPNKDKNIFLNACDVAIISLDKSMYGLGVPSKSYYNMAAGKPILFIGDDNSEIARVVNEHQMGWVIKAGDVKALSDIFEQVCQEQRIYQLLGAKSRQILIDLYSEEVILAKYQKLY